MLNISRIHSFYALPDNRQDCDLCARSGRRKSTCVSAICDHANPSVWKRCGPHRLLSSRASCASQAGVCCVASQTAITRRAVERPCSTPKHDEYHLHSGSTRGLVCAVGLWEEGWGEGLAVSCALRCAESRATRGSVCQTRRREHTSPRRPFQRILVASLRGDSRSASCCGWPAELGRTGDRGPTVVGDHFR